MHTFLFLFVTMTTATAYAADWHVTFTADTVATCVDGAGVKVMVAGVGKDDALAVAALTQALRGLTALELVMPSDALGNLAGLEDQAIVTKASKLPIDRIFIVRVFPGQDGRDTAVVSVYAKDGKVLNAFTGVRGEPLANPAPVSARGVSNGTARAIDSITRTHDDEPGALAEFEKRAVYTNNMTAVNMSTGAVVSSWTSFYKGKYREPLNGADFLDYVGKTELAAQYRQVDEKKSRLRIGYASALVVGETVFWWGLVKWAGAGISAYAYVDPAAQAEAEAAADDKRSSGKTMMLIGSLLHVGFLAGLIADASMDYPVTLPKALEYADEYNKKLAAELGVVDSDLTAASKASEPLPEGPRVQVSAAPFLMPGGGGLGLAVRF